ncbi:MAG: lipocalin-like domain-containing protein [Chloroflexi bacterium]|nr:MAG: lipocalin-like domain-containing protein [Chloroflexota bacterium]
MIHTFCTKRSECAGRSEVTLTVVGALARDLVGTWRLLSRIDRDRSGALVDERTLGSDPMALLFFDAAGNFAAQFMMRDRSAAAAAPEFTAQNNTTAVDGYDAYFGTYEVDEASGDVHTHLVAALSHSHVGATLIRNMKVDDGKLIIRLATTTPDGVPVNRMLTWERAG